MTEYDAIVIGSGPAGYACAKKTGEMGGKVVLVEQEGFGGVCANNGCIPTKALWSVADRLSKIQKSSKLGINSEAALSEKSVFRHVRKNVKIASKAVEANLRKAGVELVEGHANLVNEHQIEVSGESIQAKDIVLATGAHPTHPPHIDFDHEFVLDNKKLLELEEIPKRLVVVGAGFIGMEFASIYSQLGSQVTLIEALDKILPQEDEEVSEYVLGESKKNFDIHLQTKLKHVLVKEKKVVVESTGGEGEFEADYVLLAVGRKPNLRGYGLEDGGIKYNESGIKVDEYLKTSKKNIYAIGDVNGLSMLAHAGTLQGLLCAQNMMGEKKEYNPKVVPWSVFCFPEISHIGLTEKQARQEGTQTSSSKTPYSMQAKARCMGEEYGFIKTIVDEKTHEILGVHIVGAQSDSLSGQATIMVNNKMRVQELEKIIHIHPTLTEGVLESAKAAVKS